MPRALAPRSPCTPTSSGRAGTGPSQTALCAAPPGSVPDVPFHHPPPSPTMPATPAPQLLYAPHILVVEPTAPLPTAPPLRDAPSSFEPHLSPGIAAAAAAAATPPLVFWARIALSARRAAVAAAAEEAAAAAREVARRDLLARLEPRKGQGNE